MIGMLSLESWDEGPMPETMRSWGDWKAPAERMTSFFMVRVYESPSDSTSTPVACLLESKRIFLANVRVKTFRFVRPCEAASFRNEVWDESRVSAVGLMVEEQYWQPSREPLLKSWIVEIPISLRPPSM
jgi:hypothetical protein